MGFKYIPSAGKIEGVKNPPTIPEMIVSFLYACIFGVVCIAPWLELKDVIPLAFLALGGDKYAYNAVYIGTTVVLGVAWLVLYLVLWSKIEHDFSYTRGIIKALIWAAVALAVFCIAVLCHSLLDAALVAGAAGLDVHTIPAPTIAP